MVGVLREGLRSVGEEALPSSKSVCSILPIARHCDGPGSFGISASFVRLIEEESFAHAPMLARLVSPLRRSQARSSKKAILPEGEGATMGSRVRGVLVIVVSWCRMQQAREVSEIVLKV